MKLKEYVSYLIKQGRSVVFNNKGYFWFNYEKKSVSRAPAFILDEPHVNEISNVFKILKPLILTYNTEPGSPGDTNAYLYITSDKNYSLEKINKNGRRDARIAQRNLEFKFLDWDYISAHGFKAYADTRQRHNLSDGTREAFEKIIDECKGNPAFKALAAVKPGYDDVYGFLKLLEVEDWVEITSSYSMTEHLSLCPNNGLFNYALEYYLADGSINTVSYGVSSIQKESKKEGLHNFKMRIGFDAKPIKRKFIINPSYKFLFNKVSYGFSRILLKIFPSSRKLKKIEGVMSLITAAK